MTQEEIRGIVAATRKEGVDKLPGMTIYGKQEYIPARNGGKVRVLINRPKANGPRPVFFNFHGGGFIMGMPEFDDAFCQRACDELGIVVINVDYRLAPEFPYPAAVEDVRDVVLYVQEHAAEYSVDPTRMAIGGHSAGGTLTAGLAIWAGETGKCSFRCQVLDYPPLDMKSSAFSKPVPPGAIPPELADVFDRCYRTPEQSSEVYCSPYYATDEQLKKTPPAIVLTAEGDSLCAEAESYTARLMQNSVEVTARRFLGVGHGFSMPMCMDMEGAIGDDSAMEASQVMMIAGLKRYLLE